MLEALESLRARYLVRLHADEAMLWKIIAHLQCDNPDDTDLDALREIAHRLTGTGATLGFPEVSAAAANLADAIAGSLALATLVDIINDVLTAARDAI